MILAWLGIDLILIVLFAFALPAAFLYVIRRWLQNSEKADGTAEGHPPEAGQSSAH
ncbi:MAG: hypothetical protein N3J91_07840 [Verrucomicrobiae bacterium]|nr:hypothetical protein [Verrucomicrobiae bacterium]